MFKRPIAVLFFAALGLPAQAQAPVQTFQRLETVQMFATNPSTYGTFGAAAGASVVVNSTHLPQVLGFTTPSQASTYADRDTVGLYVDNTAPGALGGNSGFAGSFTSTSFLPSTPLSPSVRAGLKVGMLIDTTDATKFTGFITGWAANGSSITVSGWFAQGNATAGQVPAGPNAILNPITKVWGLNANAFLLPSSLANKLVGFELGVFNNKAPYDPVKDNPTSWGMDVVNLGTYQAGHAYKQRGNFRFGYQSNDAEYAGFHVNNSATRNPAFGFLSAASSGVPFAAIDPSDGKPYFQVPSLGGSLVLGKPGGGTTQPFIDFRSSSTGGFDGRIQVTGDRSSGASIFGLLGNRMRTLHPADAAIGFEVLNITGAANYLSVAPSLAGSSVKDVALGADAAINRVISGKATGAVCLGALSDCGNDALRVQPVASQINGVKVTGSVAGVAPSIIAIGGDGNIPMPVLGKGTAGALTGAFIRTGDPTVADIPSGQCADWNNTVAVTYKHVCNFGGALRSVALN